MTGPAYVVFTDETRVPFLRILKPGFRHCLVIVPLASGYISLDPLLTQVQVRYHPITPQMDLIDTLKTSGHRLVLTSIVEPITTWCVPGLFTCVTLVKRVLGVHAPSIQTPYQLYRYLERKQK